MKKKLLAVLLTATMLFASCGSATVELNIPASYVEEKTQEDLNKLCEEKGYASITLNEDGSATYVMTEAQHEKLIKDFRTEIEKSLAEMVGSENYPNFTSIEANDDYTEFTIKTKSTQLDFAESFSALGFYLYGGMYAVFNGKEVDNISVTFVNADSGDIISTSNSSEMGQ